MNDQASQQLSEAEVLRMSAHVVAAYVRNNPLPTNELSGVIATVHNSIAELNGTMRQKGEPKKPAISVRRSVTPDYLVCLEDGKKLKMLKRHLRSNYKLTPEEYRAKWGLPPDYPMVAPNYAKQRSAFAKKIGLGRTPPRAANSKS